MKIAVAGCLHGELNKIYEDIEAKQDAKDKVQILLVCGDFQSLRNVHDFKCFAAPPKYHALVDFHEYYSGKRTAPLLTLFVGGNHEASNFLASLAFGGWVAHNIYYMGYASVVNFGGLRIGGVSGIYKKHDAPKGHYETLPFDEGSKRSAYHTRELDVYKLMQISVKEVNEQPIDIILSHDWPLNIHTCGDVKKLLRAKPFLRNDINSNQLGNPLYSPVIPYLKPRYWFSAHLHVKWEAFIDHADGVSTRFMALDKTLPRRGYLEFLEIKPQKAASGDETPILEHDLEWLSILRKMDRFTSIERNPSPRAPSFTTWGYEAKRFVSSEADLKETSSLFNDDLKILANFKMTEPALEGKDTDPTRTVSYTNYQTTELCSKLKIRDPMQMIVDRSKPKPNPDQINLDDEEEEEEEKEEDHGGKKVKVNEADEALATGQQLFVIDTVGAR